MGLRPEGASPAAGHVRVRRFLKEMLLKY